MSSDNKKMLSTTRSLPLIIRRFLRMSVFFVLAMALIACRAAAEYNLNVGEYETMLNEMLNKSLGKPNTSVGERVSGWKPGDKLNPEEMGSYLESDILMPLSDFAGTEISAKTRKRWPTRVVPVTISGNFDSRERRLLAEAMERFKKHTCVSFSKYDGTQTDYVDITSEDTGCWSALGRMGGRQRLNLQKRGCTSEIGTSIHELMHAIGIPHEQSRRDRDQYVTINWRNIQRGLEHNFETHRVFNGLGAPYDYTSVMHYGPYAFSRDRKSPTIVPRDGGETRRLGQRFGFTQADIAKINNLYSCTEEKRPSSTQAGARVVPPSRRPNPELLRGRVGGGGSRPDPERTGLGRRIIISQSWSGDVRPRSGIFFPARSAFDYHP